MSMSVARSNSESASSNLPASKRASPWSRWARASGEGSWMSATGRARSAPPFQTCGRPASDGVADHLLYALPQVVGHFQHLVLLPEVLLDLRLDLLVVLGRHLEQIGRASCR